MCFVFYLLLDTGSCGSGSLVGMRHLLLAYLKSSEAVLVARFTAQGGGFENYLVSKGITVAVLGRDTA